MADRRNPKLDVLFDDADLIAVDKSAGLAAIPGRAETDSVLEQIARQASLPWTGSADPRIRVVHRLDKDTSGVMLFAKHIDAQRHLSHQFQNNTIEKEYVAIVAGRPPGDDGEIDVPIAVHSTDKKRMTTTRHGRPARTLWKVEAVYRDMALVRAFPKTGKTHQIRVHLRSIGLPLAIDELYHPTSPTTRNGLMLSYFKRDYRPADGREERPLINRLTLHAHRLTFTHPNGSRVTLEAELPKDLRSAINMLGKYSRGRSRD